LSIRFQADNDLKFAIVKAVRLRAILTSWTVPPALAFFALTSRPGKQAQGCCWFRSASQSARLSKHWWSFGQLPIRAN
jgi:hypothetical protein